MPNHKFQWAPLGEHCPEAAAGAALVADGMEPDIALRLAPIAAAINNIDAATPINPTWPGIGIVDVTEDANRIGVRKPRCRPAFVLELHANSTA